MEFTTCFGLQFQATRLYGRAVPRPRRQGIRASHPPWVVAAFKLDLAAPGPQKETLRNVASLLPPGREVRGYTLGSSLFGRTY